ncbi:MAG TPA: helix-turn-helix transcriptional regulator [Mycobacterium sp.]|nr:helix-turn-helix transcriptional regulator [Mycobacterium sp.]
MRSRYRAVREQISACCASPLDDRPFRAAVLEAFGRAVPFDAYVWVLTDPVSSVGVSPLAYLPSFDMRRLPRLIRAKYATAINRWTMLDGCVSLAASTAGQLSDSRLWRVASEDLTVADIASMVLRDRYGCWGFVDLWRYDGPPFGDEECAFAATLMATITGAQRARVARMFDSAPDQPSIGPALVLYDDDLNAVGETPAAIHSFRRLLPPNPGDSPVPAAALNVAAQLLAANQGVDASEATSRVHAGGGVWMTLTAARLQASSPGTPSLIAVTVDPITLTERVDVFSRATGLTPRETEVLVELSRGNSTRRIAGELRVSEYTVQEHLKAIFAKSETASRAQLVARACGSVTA